MFQRVRRRRRARGVNPLGRHVQSHLAQAMLQPLRAGRGIGKTSEIPPLALQPPHQLDGSRQNLILVEDCSIQIQQHRRKRRKIAEIPGHFN
jgi:hypothetical protein